MTIRADQQIMPSLAQGVYIDPQAVVIGDVTLGEDSSIWPCAVARGDVNHIRIGARSNIQDGTVLHVSHSSPFGEGYALIIGNDVTVGHNATLHACTIEDEVLIGMNATVLDGAVVPKHCIVGANALVPPGKKLESGWLYMGIPAKPVRQLTEQDVRFFAYSSEHYVRLKNHYLLDAQGADYSPSDAS
jgi:carbonic anhydrase/acetyltransferase-like protein (isoleucine patch superfamily)